MHYLEPPTCPHGGLVGSLRSGEPRCPMCRRDPAARAASRAVAAPRPRRPVQPVLDPSMLRAGDDTFTDDAADLADVVSLTARRRRTR